MKLLEYRKQYESFGVLYVKYTPGYFHFSTNPDDTLEWHFIRSSTGRTIEEAYLSLIAEL